MRNILEATYGSESHPLADNAANLENNHPCWKYCQTNNACGFFHQRTVDGENIQTLENYIIGMTPPSPHVNVKQLVRGMSCLGV